MHSLGSIVWVIGTFVLFGPSAHPRQAPSKESALIDPISIVIVFKDGHQQTFAMADIARIEYKDAGESTPGLDHFLGKWEAGDGNSGTFFITLESNGEASRSIGASHGIWVISGDEARVSWDDGWHDVLRKIGDKYEKFAFAPGTTFDDKPANVTAAWKIEPEKRKPEKIESKQ